MSERPYDRHVISVELNVEYQVVRVGGKKVPYLGCKREGGRQRNWADFTDVASNGILVEDGRSGVPGHPVDGHLEEAVRPVVIRETLDSCAGFNHGSSINVSDIEFAQCATAPGHPSHGF